MHKIHVILTNSMGTKTRVSLIVSGITTEAMLDRVIRERYVDVVSWGRPSDIYTK